MGHRILITPEIGQQTLAKIDQKRFGLRFIDGPNEVTANLPKGFDPMSIQPILNQPGRILKQKWRWDRHRFG
jgi:hypothetical protein